MASCSPDTTASTLQLYMGLRKQEFDSVLSNSAVCPCNVMNESDRRAWVVLGTTTKAALDRALWGFEELGYEPDKSQLLLITFEFTAIGFGHFTLNDMLTTRNNKHFRFYGSLPLRCTNSQGDLLVHAHDSIASVV